MWSGVLVLSFLIWCVTAQSVAAQSPATVRVTVTAADQPVTDAEVVIAGKAYRTGASGTVAIATVPEAPVRYALPATTTSASVTA